MADKAPVEIGYWAIRGLLEPLKLLCEYADQPYTLRLFKTGEEYAQFKADQPVFCNLPYLKDGDLFLVQSNAILRHLGRKNGLLGATPAEQALHDVVCEQVMDLRNDFMGVVYSSPDAFPHLARAFQSRSLPVALQKLSVMLGACQFFGGETPLYADFHAYEMLKQQTLFTEGVLSAYPNLSAYIERFEALPRIAAYLASDRFSAFPINNTSASWGTVENHGFVKF